VNRIAELNWIEFGVRFETGSFDKGVDCDCEMVGLVGKTGLYMLRWIVDVSESGGGIEDCFYLFYFWDRIC